MLWNLLRKSQMQVNSAQDWLTKQKRKIITKSIHVAPPPQSQRTNNLYLHTVANGASQRERYSSDCCSVPSPFPVTISRSVVPYNGRSVQPMSVRIAS
jgi:hypothetical protein